MKTIIKYILILIFFAIAGVMLAADPVVTNVTILGEALYNTTPNPDETTTLTGAYDFSDSDGHSDASTYQWYAGTQADGSDKVAISGATDKRYTITSNEYGDYIFFEVSPEDSNGETSSSILSSGIQTTSTSYRDANVSGTTISSGTINYLNITMDNNTTFTVDGGSTIVNVHGDFDLDNKNGITINVTNGASLTVSGYLITKNDVIINVDGTSSFIIESGLDAKNGSDLTIDGSMTINGDVDVEQNANFTVSDGGSMDVGGDLLVGDNGTIDVEGDMTVDGNLDTGTGTTITVDNDDNGSGTLDIGGDLSGDATIEGSGPVTVGGEIGPGINDTDGNQVNSPLPIELISFNGYATENQVVLSWSTASELNNKEFIIERSMDAINFTRIGTVNGNGNSSQILSYQFKDYNPEKGYNYYRLTQVDYDGKSETFSLLAVYHADGSLEKTDMKVYPNPLTSSNNTLSIILPGMTKDISANISIIDQFGNTVLKYQNETDSNGKMIQTIDTDELNSFHPYFILVQTSQSEAFKSKLIIK